MVFAIKENGGLHANWKSKEAGAGASAPSYFCLVAAAKPSTPGPHKLITIDSIVAAQSPRRCLLPAPSQHLQARWLPSLGLVPPLVLGLAIIDLHGVRADKGADPDSCREFNDRQARESPAPMELWTDGSVRHSAGGLIESGGAWCLWGAEDSILLEGSISLGAAACSYSAEAEALRDGIRLALRHLESASAPPKRIRVMSDSLSCLSELARGPHRQAEEWSEAIWASLALSSIAVTFVFQFSHVEADVPPAQNPALAENTPLPPESRAQRVDRLAKEAAPQWAKDLLRPLIKGATQPQKRVT